MGSQVCETLAYINGDEGVRGMEALQINGALLMSLMEESSPSDNHDESDDDRLDSLIRSFEAEISGSNKMGGDHDHDLASKGSEFVSKMEECANQTWNIMGDVDGVEYWGSSSSEFGVEWVDMDLVPLEDRSNWCVDPCGDEYAMANNFKVYDGFALGEHGYNSLWQDMACN
ncbi:uncharacterized protein LOC109813767 [Cajanus cajan]|uniref:Uncharacterized protein n=1 Tax=Cajanus cajan TaxID=3821 RepID=A0A151S267_CAJCA|nr:uncharacterized protein LOC109813765 [Cajanus cajan]XP_020233610.1 uncharacterized protein LOC109813766 [Cajanus cajan]XP_020233611.1 uncharacterized protein LOC109813767 [Cajanus cajan]KYP48903.1 hypothetical protein KK1_029388 [Cajanus cajan]